MSNFHGFSILTVNTIADLFKFVRQMMRPVLSPVCVWFAFEFCGNGSYRHWTADVKPCMMEQSSSLSSLGGPRPANDLSNYKINKTLAQRSIM